MLHPIAIDPTHLLPLGSDSFQMAGVECKLSGGQYDLILDLRKGDRVKIVGRHRNANHFMFTRVYLESCKILN